MQQVIEDLQAQIKAKDEEIAQGEKQSAEASTTHSRELQALEEELRSVHTENQQLKEEIQVGKWFSFVSDINNEECKKYCRMCTCLYFCVVRREGT